MSEATIEPIVEAVKAKTEKVAATAKAAKTTFIKKLAIPEKVAAGKKLAGKGVAAAKEANPYSKKNLSAASTSFGVALKGFETASSEAMSFGQKNFEENVAAAKKLAGVKTFTDFVDFQRDYATSMLASYTKQATTFAELASASAKGAVKPLSARGAAVLGQLK